MNMSLSEIYAWLIGTDFPSLSATWTWLINVPWWMAIGTVVLTVYALRIAWDITAHFFRWLFGLVFNAGGWIGDKIQFLIKGTKAVSEFGRQVRKVFFP